MKHTPSQVIQAAMDAAVNYLFVIPRRKRKNPYSNSENKLLYDIQYGISIRDLERR